MYSYKKELPTVKNRKINEDESTVYNPTSLGDRARDIVKDFNKFSVQDVIEYMGGIREIRGQRNAYAMQKAYENISNYSSKPYPVTLSKLADIVSKNTQKYQPSYIRNFGGLGVNSTYSGLIGVPARAEKEWFQPVLEYDIDNNEIVFRTMSEEDYKYLVEENKLIATSETSISPAIAYALKYKGVLVQFTLKAGTWEKIRKITLVTNEAEQALFPDLSFKKGDWVHEYAKFKKEANQITTQVGRGNALDIFNDNIIGFQRIERYKS